MNTRFTRLRAANHQPLGHKKLRGYSLIELMISITLGLIIISGLLVVFVNSRASSKTNDRTAEVMSNGRFALATLKEDLRAAGFVGYLGATPNTPTTTLTPITNECLETGATASTFVSNIGQGIWGSKDSNPFSANCIPASHYARGDVLVIRKLSPTAATSLSANQLYFRSSYAAGEIFRGAPTAVCPAPQSGYTAPFDKAPCLAGSPGVDLLNFPIEVHVYFIRPYTVSATESPLTPALCRLVLNSGGIMAEEVVASGIEDMRIQYSVSLTNQTSQYLEANSIVGASTATSSDWDNVSAARVWLLARNSTIEPGYSNTTVYNLASSTYPRTPPTNFTGDSYRRQMFNTVVQLRNPAL